MFSWADNLCVYLLLYIFISECLGKYINYHFLDWRRAAYCVVCTLFGGFMRNYVDVRA